MVYSSLWCPSRIYVCLYPSMLQDHTIIPALCFVYRQVRQEASISFFKRELFKIISLIELEIFKKWLAAAPDFAGSVRHLSFNFKGFSDFTNRWSNEANSNEDTELMERCLNLRTVEIHHSIRLLITQAINIFPVSGITHEQGIVFRCNAPRRLFSL
ncbi:uncharacterized protein BDZ99DRAFT_573241 [Mytilinidion resinicola]|uniref:Uncharacterized protein n=1 Tax=Mytilinidion resinicola TaxID=574789 RepID=A0A6A6YF96_9PEZI|nr:uncharacterized protein BDZ99DRAFT_573241 [Mytilinidion resinicola]KAF2807410.1 hypothetical protein BDZ99DRAFT_573241 [Mytilinidion resinicola]